MPLNHEVAELRRRLLDDLLAGRAPSTGAFDAESLAHARTKGRPQLGTVRFEPRLITLEFIYSDPQGAASIFEVAVEPRERIVFLPVPEWVRETIWQGEIDGSYHYVSDARTLLARFEEEIEPEPNAKWFGPQPPKRRE